MKLHWTLTLAMVVLGAACASAQSERAAPRQASSFGVITGRVTNPSGAAQAGVPVLISRRDGRFEQTVYTEANGRFRFPRLAPGIYAAAILLPSLLPYWKSPIVVGAGAEILLDISLRRLTDSLQVQWPENPSEAREEWKWVLRNASPPRPILRFAEDESAPGAAVASENFANRDLRGIVQFLAGNRSQGFGQSPGMVTSFDMEYGLTNTNLLGVAGSAGWEHGTPAASLRTAWTRHTADGNRSTVSATVRQLFLPADDAQERDDVPERASRDRLQSLTFTFEQESEVSPRVHLYYGTLLDALSVGDNIVHWSPFGQMLFAYSDATQFKLFFTAAAPRVLPSNQAMNRQRMEQWLSIPQLSADGSLRPVLERGKHLEADWEREGKRVRLHAAAFYDSLSNAALSLASGNSDAALRGVLRDPFSSRRFLSGGSYSSPGTRASVALRLPRESEIAVGYSYAANLQASSQELHAETPQSLRTLIEPRRGHSFVAKVSSTIPTVHTRVTTAYRWLPAHSVIPADPYDQSFTHSEPYLNIVLLQPIPSPGIIPGQFQAVADFTNLLAQGYLTVASPDGSRTYLFPGARAFRGGFSFIF